MIASLGWGVAGRVGNSDHRRDEGELRNIYDGELCLHAVWRMCAVRDYLLHGHHFC